MTITLRCTHCDQPMAIAPRKPGSQVTCPACGRSVVVPLRESAEPPPSSPRPAGVLAAAHAAATQRETARAATPTSIETKARPRAAPAAEPTAARVHTKAVEPAEPSRLVEQPELAEPHFAAGRDRTANWVSMPVSAIILALIFALAALGIAFYAGMLFGSRDRAARGSGERPTSHRHEAAARSARGLAEPSENPICLYRPLNLEQTPDEC